MCSVFTLGKSIGIIIGFSWRKIATRLWVRHQCVVLNFQDTPVIIVTQVDFLWFPTAYLFEAFITNFLTDQNAMACNGGDPTLHFCHKTMTGPLTRDLNLDEIINIGTDR